MRWRIGQLGAISLYLHASWFLTLGLVSYGYAQTWTVWAPGELWPWLVGLGMALLGFGSLILHELAHSGVALTQGVPVRSISLFIFGGQAILEREAPTWYGSLAIALAGPVLSLMLFGTAQILAFNLPLGSIPRTVAETLALTNLLLAAFNLLPGLPLDGGNVLKALIWGYTGDQATGIRWAAWAGQVLGLVLVLGGLGGVWAGYCTLWVGCWITGIGSFVGILALRYLRHSQSVF